MWEHKAGPMKQWIYYVHDKRAEVVVVLVVVVVVKRTSMCSFRETILSSANAKLQKDRICFDWLQVLKSFGGQIGFIMSGCELHGSW